MFLNITRIILSFLLVTTAVGQTIPLSPKEEKKEYTLEEKAKLKQAEELADRFVKRWHETLDLDVLVDEFFVQPDELRGMIEDGFGFFIDDWNEEIDSNFHQFAINVIGDEPARKAVLAFLNVNSLWLELKLLYSEQEVRRFQSIMDDAQFDELNRGIFEWFQKRKSTDPYYKMKIPKAEAEQIRQSVEKLSYSFDDQTSYYRAKLSREFFDTEQYKANLEREHGVADESEIVSKEDADAEKLRLKKEAKLYCVERGVFRLLIVEEQGQFKVFSFAD